MNTNRKTAIMVGVLYIIGTVAGILSVIFTGSLLAPDYLTAIADEGNRVIIGVLFVLIMGIALTFIPPLLHPIFKKHNERLSLGYIVFRSALESITYILSSVVMLLLVTLSITYTRANATDIATFEVLGNLLQGADGWINNMRIIVFGISALIINTILYQTKLIPRWISSWGLAAAVLHLVNGFLNMFGFVGTMSSIGTLLDFPIFLQEMVLALWLIIKGFDLKELP